MSTKIWTAYKLDKISDLPKLVADVQRQGRENVRAKLRELVERLVAAPEMKGDERYKKELERRSVSTPQHLRERAAAINAACLILREGYKSQLGEGRRSDMDFNVSVAVRFHGRGAYLIPHCDMHMCNVLNFLSEHPLLSDFHYQNQTDKPEEISDKEWRKRERVWDAIDERGWSNYVLIEVCSWDSYFAVEPSMDLLRELYAEERRISAEAERNAATLGEAAPALPDAERALEEVGP
jgi:hypothetical protein